MQRPNHVRKLVHPHFQKPKNPFRTNDFLDASATQKGNKNGKTEHTTQKWNHHHQIRKSRTVTSPHSVCSGTPFLRYAFTNWNEKEKEVYYWKNLTSDDVKLTLILMINVLFEIKTAGN